MQYVCPTYLSVSEPERESSALKAELNHAHAQVLCLEEELEEARDTIRRLIEGDAVEWI